MNCIVYDGGLQWGSTGTVLVLLFIFVWEQKNRPHAYFFVRGVLFPSFYLFKR